MKDKKYTHKNIKVFGWALFIATVFLIVFFVAPLVTKEIKLKRNCKTVNGVVTDIEEVESGIDIVYSYNVKFTINNNEYRTKNQSANDVLEYKKGDQISVIYSQDDPTINRLNIDNEFKDSMIFFLLIIISTSTLGYSCLYKTNIIFDLIKNWEID
jgi:hypothetical protein